MAWISAKYAGKCQTCRASVSVGQEVYWVPKAKGVTCRACKTTPTATLENADVFKSTATLPAGAVWIDSYESIAAFKARCSQPIHPGNARRASSKAELAPDADVVVQKYIDGFWGDAKTARDAWYALQHGWPAGLAKADELMELFPAPRVPGKRRRRVWLEDGDDFDRDRYQDGREDYWAGSKLESAQSGRLASVRVVVQGNVSCGRSAEDYLWSGLAATALCDAIETNGIRVQLDVCFPSESWWLSGPRVAGPLVTVKAADEPLDRGRIIAWTGHPVAHRVATFRWADVSGEEAGGYGNNSDTAASDYREALKLEDGDIFVRRIFDRHAAVNFVHAELTRLGIQWD